MKNILWLASWYPNRKDNFDGDFIQRHAKAVSLFCKVQVIFVVKNNDLPDKTVEEKTTGNLTEQIIYYKSFRTGINLLDRFFSQQKYNRLYRKAISTYININGKPDCVHVHVAMKAGLLALWIKEKWNIPFVVTEHWTGYLTEADKRLNDFPTLYRSWLKQILEKSSMLTVVSDHLGKAIQNHFPHLKYQVIPNVVDTEIFYPVRKLPGDHFQFIHASTMTFQKNTETILHALQLLKKNIPLFTMQLFGPVKPELQKMIKTLGLQNHVFLKGEVPQVELARAMQQADALILYSRFETFGCVLIETNACGIPVIVSELKVFHELVTENENGVFAEGNNPDALAKKIAELIANKDKFNAEKIAGEAAAKYSFACVGKRFVELYELLNGSK